MLASPNDAISRQHTSTVPFPEPQSSSTKLLPKHWESKFDVPSPYAAWLELGFKALCLIALGRVNLQQVWADTTNPDSDTWTSQKDRLGVKMSNINIVSGLLLTTTAAFATTNPPVPHLLDYSQPGPYICILLSFGLTLGGLIVGSALVYTMSQCSSEWYVKTLMASRSRVCCTLFMIAYPFLSIGVATAISAFGLLIAAWNSQNRVIRDGSTFVLLIPVSLIPVFGWTQLVIWAQWTKRAWVGRRAAWADRRASWADHRYRHARSSVEIIDTPRMPSTPSAVYQSDSVEGVAESRCHDCNLVQGEADIP